MPLDRLSCVFVLKVLIIVMASNLIAMAERIDPHSDFFPLWPRGGREVARQRNTFFVKDEARSGLPRIEPVSWLTSSFTSLCWSLVFGPEDLLPELLCFLRLPCDGSALGDLCH